MKYCGAMSSLTIQPVSLEATVSVLQASALSFQRRGLPMWSQEALTADVLTRQYPGAQGYLGQLDGQPVATMILVPTDAQFWPDDPPGEALYLHKLAVHPDWQGRAFGTVMVQAAIQETRAAGRPWLRLDTAAERPKLRAIYEALGFTPVREGQMDGWPAAWYELKV